MSAPNYTNAQRIQLWLKELAEQVDTCWLLKRNGHSGTLSVRLLQETASGLQDLSTEDREEYFRLAIEVFEAREPQVVQARLSPEKKVAEKPIIAEQAKRSA